MKMSTRYGLAVVVVGVLAASCNAPPTGNGGGSSPTIDQNQPGFLYVLQPEGIVLNDIIRQPFTWLVLEPSRTGDAEGEITAAEIESIRTDGPCGGKSVLAYLSIGEAEDYRDYWNPVWVDEQGMPQEGVAPTWLGPPNPDFGGNYKVRYWDTQWQALILGVAAGENRTPLDRIIDAGFDGVYLDIVDAYEFWSNDEGGRELTRAEARDRMIAWVARISEYAKVTRGAAGFLVFPQNADDIIRNDEDRVDDAGEAYLVAIDGIGIEDLFYSETSLQPDNGVQYRLCQLVEYRDRGKTVLVTDYVVDESVTPATADHRVADFYERTLAQDFIPYAAVEDRDLDEVVVLSPAAWSISQPPTDCPGPDD